MIPIHEVFEGRVGALTGKNALHRKGQRDHDDRALEVNRDTRPHLIGGHGDYVWEAGKFNNPPERGLET